MGKRKSPGDRAPSTTTSADRSDRGMELAGIQYAGIAGGSKDCQDAVLRLVQFRDRISHVAILSCGNNHGLLLTVGVGDRVAIKSGFASGYGGEGPRRFSYVLQVLDSHGADIEEYTVSQELLDRLDSSALTKRDIKRLQTSRPNRPAVWHDYIWEHHFQDARNGTLWHAEFPSVLPLALIDSRIIDLALSFWDSPDNSLLIGYRRLEDIVRERTDLDQHGIKLFGQAFSPSGGKLTWDGIDEGERAARMNLFNGTYGAYRNPRAHKEKNHYSEELAAEFLLLNHLYRLEKTAIEVQAESE